MKNTAILKVLALVIALQPQPSNALTPQEETEACTKSLSDDPHLSRLKGKVGLTGVIEQTFEMKTNSAYPTALEKKAITLWVGKVRKCTEIIEKSATDGHPITFFFPYPEQLPQFQPSIVPVMKGLYPLFEQRALQLYDKKMTYGEFARARDEDYSAFQKEVERVKQTIAQQQQQSKQKREQEEQAQRQAWQEQGRNTANEKAARCQVARQNAATFCNRGNQGVVVNVGPNTYQNSNQNTLTDSFNCGYWGGKVMEDCR